MFVSPDSDPQKVLRANQRTANKRSPLSPLTSASLQDLGKIAPAGSLPRPLLQSG